MQALALWIALRCLWRGDNRYVRLVNWMSVLGLGLGVLVLTVVVSVMNGFAVEVRTRILGAMPHALLTGRPPADPAQVAAMPGVTAAYRFFRAQGMAASGAAAAPVAVYAVEPAAGGSADAASALAGIGGHMLEGELAAALRQPQGLIMGLPLARRLDLLVGDEVRLVLPEAFAGTVRPRFKRYRLAGLFLLGSEFDHGLVLVSRRSFSAQELRRLGADGVRVTLAEPMQAERFAAAWRVRGGAPAELWTDNYGELFQAVRIEKALMFLILLLVVVVAGFNIVAGQSMVVDGKRGPIAVLRTLGATGALVRGIFLLQGLLIASLGIAVGLALGVAAALNVGPIVAQVESWFGFRFLEGAYFDAVPAQVRAADLAVIGGASWLLCLAAAWLPARRAAAQQPVRGLHLR